MQIPPASLVMRPAPGSTYRMPGTVWQLGWRTQVNPYNGNVLMNLPLIEALAHQKAAIIRPLSVLLNTSMYRYQVIEGLYLAQRLAELNTPGVQTLYAATTRLQYTTDPLIQVYLAGFYRKLNVPESFGPMLEMLIRQAQRPPVYQPGRNPMEEVGGTILQQIAEFSAQAVLKQLGKGWTGPGSPAPPGKSALTPALSNRYSPV